MSPVLYMHAGFVVGAPQHKVLFCRKLIVG